MLSYPRQRVRLVLGVLLGVLVVPYEAWAEPLTLTLSQAIKRALAENRQLKAEAQGLESAKGDRLSAFKTVLPTAETSAFYRWNLKKNVLFFPNTLTGSIDTIELGKDKTVDFRAEITQPLFDFGGMVFTMRAAGLSVNAERARLHSAENDVIYETTVAYYRVQYLDRHAKNQQQFYLQSEASLHAATVKRDLDLANAVAVLEKESELESRRVAALEAEHALREAHAALSTLLHLPPKTALVLTDPIAIPSAPAPLEHVLEQASVHNPFLRELGLRSRALKAAWRSKQTTWAPRLDGQFHYVVQGETDDAFPSDDEFVTSKSVALVASFPVFDGLAREGEIKQAKAAYLKSVYELEQSLREFRDEVEKTYDALVTARAEVLAERKTTELAEATYRDAKSRYAGGLIPALALRDAELSLERSQVRMLRAEWNAIGQTAYLDRLIGKAGKPAKETP